MGSHTRLIFARALRPAAVTIALCFVWLVWPTIVAAQARDSGGRGVEPLPVTGRAVPALQALDDILLQHLRRRGIPGGALAVSYRGRLVYDRGFGYADVEAKQPVRPTSLFRIASVTKPITAVAILRLVDQGKLRLNDRVFDILRPQPLGEAKVDPRFKKITVHQLLQHRGGFNRRASFDPMFRSHIIAAAAGHSGPARSCDVIRYMIGRELDFAPGEFYCYSNFGYCLLGRVIEKVTGTPYADHVRESVFAPLGIREIRLGRSLAEHRLPNEVRYYGQDWRQAVNVFAPQAGLSVPWPYGGFHFEAMDSDNGWLASASDLVRFARDFDDPKASKLLSPARIQEMFARPPGFAGATKDGKPRPDYYACGWLIREGTQDSGGSLPGTTAKLFRRDDGIVWCVLFNTRHDKSGKRIHPDDLQDDMQSLLDSITVWPRN